VRPDLIPNLIPDRVPSLVSDPVSRGWQTRSITLGPVVISGRAAETVGFSCPNRRNKGLKPLAPNDPVTVESGFWAI